jgi:hypothetical protein
VYERKTGARIVLLPVEQKTSQLSNFLPDKDFRTTLRWRSYNTLVRVTLGPFESYIYVL